MTELTVWKSVSVQTRGKQLEKKQETQFQDRRRISFDQIASPFPGKSFPLSLSLSPEENLPSLSFLLSLCSLIDNHFSLSNQINIGIVLT